eukprot:UN27539
MFHDKLKILKPPMMDLFQQIVFLGGVSCVCISCAIRNINMVPVFGWILIVVKIYYT